MYACGVCVRVCMNKCAVHFAPHMPGIIMVCTHAHTAVCVREWMGGCMQNNAVTAAKGTSEHSVLDRQNVRIQ